MFVNATLDLMEMVKTAKVYLISLLKYLEIPAWIWPEAANYIGCALSLPSAVL